jgi:hypothetical protein
MKTAGWAKAAEALPLLHAARPAVPTETGMKSAIYGTKLDHKHVLCMIAL